jgi:polyferredoxin
MLRKIRITFAALFFAFITLLFLDFTGTLHVWLGWMAKIQFVPALLAHSAAILLGVFVLTLLFGRVYCSVICPLGIFQDGVARLSRKRKRKGFRYARPLTWLRYGVLAAFVIALAAGVSVVVSLLDPYAAFGRMTSNLLTPVYYWGNNLLASLAERYDSYAFYSIDVWLKSGITLGVTVATFFIIGVMAWLNGRVYCNTICPVGTLLGYFSRFSIFKVVFDKEKCTHCKSCERGCKSSCIDAETMIIDHSRCVNCFNCIKNCKPGGLKYLPLKKTKLCLFR